MAMAMNTHIQKRSLLFRQAYQFYQVPTFSAHGRFNFGYEHVIGIKPRLAHQPLSWLGGTFPDT
jgi:hypothetical protein